MALQEKLVKAKVQLLRNSPFFGTLLLNSKYIVTDEIPTAATTGQVVLLNEEFMDSHNQAHFNSIIVHEVLHMCLEHVERMKDLFTVDAQLANLAADIVVNGIITAQGMSLPESAITDKKLEHLSVREIYSILRQKQQEDPNYVQKKYGTGSDGVNECLIVKVGDGSADRGDKEAGGHSTNWKDVLSKAAAIAKSKGYGLKGSGLTRIFKDLLQPTINWRDALYKYITAAHTDFEGFDRRFIHSGEYLDDLAGGRIKVAVFMDTSGSVDEELLSEFMAELRFAVSVMPSISGEMWYFDTELYALGDIEEMFENPKIKGGGGTDFVPALNKLNEVAEEDSTAKTLGIIFTDGWADLRHLPEVQSPVLWCINPGGVEDSALPFGEVVRITK